MGEVKVLTKKGYSISFLGTILPNYREREKIREGVRERDGGG